MIVTLLFFAGLMAVAAWWLVRQGLGTKPWLQAQPAAELVATGRPSLPTAKSRPASELSFDPSAADP